MNYIDYIILIILAIGFLLGFKDGLVRKIIGLIGLVVAILLAFEFSSSLGKLLIPFFNNDEYLSDIVAGILIFFVVIFIASILKRIIHPLDKVNRFVNQFIGGIVGIIQIAFFLSALFLFLNIFTFPDQESKKDSLLYTTFSELIPVSFDYIIGHRSKATNFLKNAIINQDIDTTIQTDTLKINP